MTEPSNQPLVLLDQVPRQPELVTRLEKHVRLEIADYVDNNSIGRYESQPKILVVRSPTQVQAKALEKFADLKAVVVLGSGTDCVDKRAAKKLGIDVRGNPGIGAQSVAEFVIGMMVYLARNFAAATQFIPHSRDWSERPQLSSRELAGKTLGIVGVGEIGSRVAQMAKDSFGMRIVAFDPSGRVASRGDDLPLLSTIDELMEVSDVVTVHASLTDRTRDLIGRRELGACQRGTLLINTSRGGIVNEADLVTALERGQLASASVDVFADEPPSRCSPLLSAPNVVLTPHIAGLTQEADKRLHAASADTILEILGLG